MTLDIAALARPRAGPNVIFLGAGAGMADGLPSTEEMARRIRDKLGERMWPSFAWYPSFQTFFARGDTESLMALVADVSPGVADDPTGMVLYRVLVWAAANSAHLPDEGTHGMRRRLLEHFYARDGKLYVLTTNWDTSLDTIVREIAGNATIDYGLFPNDPTSAEWRSEGKTIHLYKLNGSPDWFVCTKCGFISVAKNEDHLEQKAYCTECGIWVPRLMVLPSRNAAVHPLGFIENTVDENKYEARHFRLVQLATHATMAIEMAEELVFVGYSLPHYDQEISFLLSAGLRANLFAPFGRGKITVVGMPNDPMRANFELLFAGIPFRYVDTGLAGYLAEVER